MITLNCLQLYQRDGVHLSSAGHDRVQDTQEFVVVPSVIANG